MPANSPDPVVAQAAIDANSVLVTWDKGFSSQTYDAPRYAALNRIGLCCPEDQAVARLRTAILDIEREWTDVLAGRHLRLTLRVGRFEIRLAR